MKVIERDGYLYVYDDDRVFHRNFPKSVAIKFVEMDVARAKLYLEKAQKDLDRALEYERAIKDHMK